MAAKPFLYLVGQRPYSWEQGAAVHVCDVAGNTLQEFTAGATVWGGSVYGVHVDADGYLYLTTDRYSATVEKRRPNGELVWQQVWALPQWTLDQELVSIGTPRARYIVADAAGYLYVSGVPTQTDGTATFEKIETENSEGWYTLRKYAPADGALQWEIWAGYNNEYGLKPAAITVLDDGSRVIIADTKRVRSYSGATGVFQWEITPLPEQSNCQGIALTHDASGNIYLARTGYPDINAHRLYKYSSTGSLLAVSSYYLDWTPAPIDLMLDSNGDVLLLTDGYHYVYAPDAYWTYFTLYKANGSTLDMVWAGRADNVPPFTDSPVAGGFNWSDGTAIRRDIDDNLYITQQFVPGVVGPIPGVYLLNPDGTYRLTIEVPYNNPQYALAVVEPARRPPLSTGVMPALPILIGDWYSRLFDSLPLAVAVGSCTALRDYVGPHLPEALRARLTGTPDLSLPLARLSARRNSTGLTLTVVVPAATAEVLDEISARSAGELVIERGVRFPDNTLQLEEFLRAPLTGVRYDAGTVSASVTLTAANGEPATGGLTRTLRGISYRALQSGVRRVRCTPDTYLRPGDVALLGGGESLIVGEIVLTVSPTQSTMEIVELAE